MFKTAVPYINTRYNPKDFVLSGSVHDRVMKAGDAFTKGGINQIAFTQVVWQCHDDNLILQTGGFLE